MAGRSFMNMVAMVRIVSRDFELSVCANFAARCKHGEGTYYDLHIVGDRNAHKRVFVASVSVLLGVRVDCTSNDSMDINLFKVVIGDILGRLAQHGGLDHLVHGDRACL